MPDIPLNENRSRVLACLSGKDRALLNPHLDAVALPLGKCLESASKLIEHIFFIDSGFASVVANGQGDRSIELGLIGREGVTGMAVILGSDRSPNATIVQCAGTGRRISAGDLRAAMNRSRTLRRALLNQCHVFAIQAGQTALANATANIPERLARWLCMAHDRIDGDDLRLTHQWLSLMLAVRRPGVSLALEKFEKSGITKTRRGIITIVDREGLEENTHGAYGAPEAEFRRLLG
jgi:CRP-like cAMP-binding protein